MTDDTLKLQAEISRIEAEASKFRHEADEIRWRMRPIWSYGKWFFSSIIAGLTLAGAFYGGFKQYYDYQEKILASEQVESARAKEEAEEKIKKVTKEMNESFARGQDQIKEQQAEFKQRETKLLELISSLQGRLDSEVESSQITALAQAREIQKSFKAFTSKQEDRPLELLTLRTKPKTISSDEISASIRKNNFSLNGGKIQGSFRPSYVLKDDSVVIDQATNLMWERGGSYETVTFDKANDYVTSLNIEKLGGYSDWRLPTIEELLSLLTPRPQNGSLYISEYFNDRQRWIISADDDGAGRGWGLVFYEGKLYLPTRNFPYYVRAVRTHM